MGWTRHTQREEQVSFPYGWVNGHVRWGLLLSYPWDGPGSTAPVALDQPALDEQDRVPEAIPANLRKTAEILERRHPSW